jgi:formate dehydrogenase subunit delta
MKSTDMIRLANQIATFFKSYPHEEAVAETAGHINSSLDLSPTISCNNTDVFN